VFEVLSALESAGCDPEDCEFNMESLMKDSGFGLRAPCDAYSMEADEADFLKDHERALSELSEWAAILRRHGLDIIE
jgi:hypothetical protein